MTPLRGAEAPELEGVHRTALSSAAMRASHLLCDTEPYIFQDPFALALAGMTPDQAIAWAGPDRRRIVGTWLQRARYAEDRLAEARGRVTQYVILGAGLDSFALRRTGQLSGLRIFEVDDPRMQRWKRARIAELGLALSPELVFVPCEFEQTPLAVALAAAGFDALAPTFTSWLGVTQYLSAPAIDETLAWAGARAGGSELVLTHIPPGLYADRLKAQMQAKGTSMATFLSSAEMDAALRRAGFHTIEEFTRERTQAAYFQDRTDGLVVTDLERIVSAMT